eukprot:3935191-Rhodomonas_salina.2
MPALLRPRPPRLLQRARARAGREQMRARAAGGWGARGGRSSNTSHASLLVPGPPPPSAPSPPTTRAWSDPSLLGAR